MVIKINDKAGKLVITLAVTLLLLQGMVITKNAIVTYIGKEFVTPFTNGVLVTPKKKLTTEPLHIEYTVLKAPTAKTTVAKK